MKDIRANAVANMLVRLLNIVFPLITTAYLSRVLSKPLYGEFNVANAYLNLFIPFATLGVYNYGIREISKVKSDPDKINKMFSTLFYVSVFCTTITTVFFIWLMPLYTTSPSIQLLIVILGIQLVAQILYIEWMNEAFENYTFLFYKTLLIRIGMLVSIFAFVRDSGDIIPYALIVAISQLVNYLASFVWIKRDVRFVHVPIEDYKKLFKPLIGLFLLANAGMLYTSLDQTFISKIAAPEEVSYYTNGQRIVMLISGVVSGAISVSVPRLGYYVGLGDRKAYRELVKKSSRLFSFFICPIGMGIAVLGTQATVLMYSEKYLAGGIVTTIFAVRTISWAMEIIFGTQIILVNGYETKLTQFYFVGGIVNLVLNSLLYVNGVSAPQYYILTTLMSEYVLLILEYIFIKNVNIVHLKEIIGFFRHYTAITLGFIPLTILVNYLYPVKMMVNLPFLLNILAIVIICVIYYVMMLAILKDKVFMQIVEGVKVKLRG